MLQDDPLKGRLLLVTLSHFPNFHFCEYSRLIKRYRNTEEIFLASYSDFISLGFKADRAKKLAEHIRIFNPKKQIDKLEAEGINLLTLFDDDYPKLLKNIYDPPLVLYMKGNIDLIKDDILRIAVVGARKASLYGREVTENITGELAEAGTVIVSGMAYGIDSFAHLGAIKNHGYTIAVLACGVDVVYPFANARLYENILRSQGLILSEYPLGTRPEKYRFPLRNRIIAGLSNGVILMEGAKNSGSLITAEYALKEGREVYALPGPVTSLNSFASLYLIKNGAKCISDSNDVLEDWVSYSKKETKENKIRYSSEVKLVLDEIRKNGHITADEISKETGFTIAQVRIFLSELEIEDTVFCSGSEYFVKKNASFRF